MEDSLSKGWMENNLPDEFLEQNTEPKPTPGWEFRGKTDGVFPLPNIELFKEKNQTPIPGFKGWYFDKLADIGK